MSEREKQLEALLWQIRTTLAARNAILPSPVDSEIICNITAALTPKSEEAA